MSREKPTLPEIVHFWIREYIETVDDVFISFPVFMDDDWYRSFNVIHLAHKKFRTRMHFDIQLKYVGLFWAVETYSKKDMTKTELKRGKPVFPYDPEFFDDIGTYIQEWITENLEKEDEEEMQQMQGPEGPERIL